MKGKTIGRGLNLIAASLAVGLGMTACSRDYVAGYVYATNSKAIPGLLTAYGVDFQSGALSQLADSPIPAGGNNSVTLVASPNGKYLYVINHDTSSVVQFDVGTDGKIYAINTYSVVSINGNSNIGTYPTAAAVDASGKFLFVAFTYQNGFTTVKPGPGGLATFPINADGSLGSALLNTTVGTTAANPLPYIPLGNNPVNVAVSKATAGAPTGFVYVIDQESPVTSSAQGVLLSFTENTTTGALTPIAGRFPTAAYPNGVAAGITPSALTEDPSGHYLYVTDQAGNQLLGYNVTPAGTPVAMAAPFPTGLGPDAVTIDPHGQFVYVANYSSSTVSGYLINQNTGSLVSTGNSISVGTGPTCITVEPALGLYLYTSNYLDNSISAEQLDPKTGVLQQVQGTQFSSQTQPSCAVAVANGAHATQ
jgi:6-phosphogluconolactonase